MRKDEKINIVVQDEKTKEEVIYNNVVTHLNLSMADEVKYLKGKMFSLEGELKSRMMLTLIYLFAFITLIFGIVLIAFDLYLLGAVLIFSTFAFVIVKIMLHYRSAVRIARSNEFDKVDELKKLLESKLK